MKRYLPILASVLSQVLFGFAYFFIKMGMEVVDQNTVKFLAFRFVTAFAVMSLLRLAGLIKLDYKDKPLRIILLAGLFNPLISQVLESTSTTYAPTSQIAVFNGLQPMLIIIFSIFVNKERPSRRQVYCMLICVFGVLAINLVDGQMTGGTTLGIVLILGTNLAIPMNRVYVRRASGYFTAFEIIYATTGMGALGFTVITLCDTAIRQGTLVHFFDGLGTPNFVKVVLYMAVGSCICGFILLTYAAANLPIAVSSTLGTLSTVIAIVVGVAFLGETFRPIDIAGTVVILCGLFGIALSYNNKDPNANRFQTSQEE